MGVVGLRVFSWVWLVFAFAGMVVGFEGWVAFVVLSGVNSTGLMVVSALKGEE